MMRETKTLKGLFPDPKPPRRKNFIKENVKSVRRMEQLFHTTNKSAKDLKLPILKVAKSSKKDNRGNPNHNDLNEKLSGNAIENNMEKLLNQKSFHEDRSRKKSAPIISTKKSASKKLSRPSVKVIRKNHSEGDVSLDKLNEAIQHIDDEIISKIKNQGVQTLDTTEINSIYSEGIIRYPSGAVKEAQKSKPSDRGDTAQLSEGNESDGKHDSDHSLEENAEYAKGSKERVPLTSKLVTQLNSSSAPPASYRVGVVPKYIKQRKEALQKEKLARAAAKQTDCPSGHVPVPDHERKETLSMLKKNYQEYVSELNMLPIRTDTLRSQKRKMEIEKQLTKLEEAIKVFSRPKVFVKVDS